MASASSPTGARNSRTLATLDLPTDRPRPPVQSYRGTRLVVALPGELVGG